MSVHRVAKSLVLHERRRLEEIEARTGHRGYNKPVFVYLNLHLTKQEGTPIWSIKNQQGKVIGHEGTLHLKEVQFRVGKAGRERVRREKAKNVHAGVVGKIIHESPAKQGGMQRVTYNPYKYETFVELPSEKPIVGAKEVVMREGKVWARGIQYAQQESGKTKGILYTESWFNEFKADMKKQMLIVVGAPASGKGFFIANSFGKMKGATLAKSFPRLKHLSTASTRESDNTLRRLQYRAAQSDFKALSGAPDENKFNKVLRQADYSYTADGKTVYLRDAIRASGGWEWFQLAKQRGFSLFFGKKGNPVNKYYMSMRGRDITGRDNEDLKKVARKVFNDTTKTALLKKGDVIIVDTAGEDINATPFEKFFKMAKEQDFTVTLVELRIPLELSIQRNALRGKKGRSVPDSQIKAAFNAMDSKVKQLLKHPDLDRYVKYVWKATGNGPFDGYFDVGADKRMHIKRDIAAMKAKKARKAADDTKAA